MRKHGPWTIEHRTERFANSFLKVEEDRVKKPDGSPGTYATVTLKHGVAVLPIAGDDDVHLTRQFRYAIGRESVEVASGATESGEEPLDAARREAREELGITAGEWTDLGPVDLDTSIVQAPVRLFVAAALEVTAADPDS